MRLKILASFLMATLLVTAGCGKSKNELDKYSTSEFGQKRAESYARESGLGSAADSGEEPSALRFGKDGGFGMGGGGRTKADVRADKMFAGALDVVMDLPIAVADRQGGFLSTEWKTNPQDPNVRYRLNIRVSGKEPYGDVRVVVLKQERVADQWEDRPADTQLAAQIEKAIRKSAQAARP